jgi:glycosyltransferase involved in cell wall biosynthesis
MFLTIITITYNAEAFLERTIVSIVEALQEAQLKRQSNGTFCGKNLCLEYLIIDGNSKDATLEIIKKYENFVSSWISEPDAGLYDAMNKGQQKAQGDYVWFMNAGDEIHDKQVLQNLAHLAVVDADVYYSDALFVNNDGTQVGLRSQVTPHKLPQNLQWTDMALGMKVCHQSFIAKKSTSPLYDVSNLSADIDWEIKVLKAAAKIIYLDFVLSKYLVGGLSVQRHRQSLIDRFKVLRHHFGLIPTIFNHIKILLRALSK